MLLIYDSRCLLCKDLAFLVSKRSHNRIEIQAWTSFLDSEMAKKHSLTEEIATKSIAVVHDNKLYLDTNAWLLILEHYPDLRPINWLASKLGLQEITAKTLNYSSRAARMFCSNCPSYVNRLRRKR